MTVTTVHRVAVTGQAVIDRIQVARKTQDRYIFSSVLNDVMVELGWTEQQAADNLDTSETIIQRWMTGRNIPTLNIREVAYEHMICSIIERDTIVGMTVNWMQQNHRFGMNVLKLTLGLVAIGFVVWLALP